MVSSVSAWQIMASKVFGLGAATLSQVALWILMGAVVAGQGLGADYVSGAASIFTPNLAAWFVVFLVLGFGLYSCFFALIGATVPTEQDAQHFVFPITMSLVLPVVIEFAIIDDPNATWVRVLSYLPPVSPGIMLMRNAFSQVPVWEPLLSAIILILAIVGVAWFSGRVFRIGILMTGKRPTLPEIMKWVRYS
jgi:ABC-2 type transport system permease protein